MIDQHIKKIMSETDLKEEEILEKVEQKVNDLDGLISREGAVYIVANSLNVELNKNVIIDGKLTIGMKNVNVILRVVNMYDTIEFNKNNNSGKVKSLWCANNELKTRVVLWNEIIDSLGEIKIGDVISISNAYTKENRNGSIEIHCSNYSELKQIEDNGSIKPVEKLQSEAKSYNNKEIDKVITENDKIQIKGFIVNLFQIRFFEVCPDCGKRVKELQNEFNCEQHGTIKPIKSYVITAIIDDGTGTIRATFFRELVCKLTDKTNEEILKLETDLDALAYELQQIKGDYVMVSGNTKLNSFSGLIELNVNEINKNINLDEEILLVKEKLSKLD